MRGEKKHFRRILLFYYYRKGKNVVQARKLIFEISFRLKTCSGRVNRSLWRQNKSIDRSKSRNKSLRDWIYRIPLWKKTKLLFFLRSSRFFESCFLNFVTNRLRYFESSRRGYTIYNKFFSFVKTSLLKKSLHFSTKKKVYSMIRTPSRIPSSKFLLKFRWTRRTNSPLRCSASKELLPLLEPHNSSERG